MNELLPWVGIFGALVLAALALRWTVRRLALSAAKHRSLRGHSRMARRVARLVPYYEFTGSAFFAADGADVAVAERRRLGFERLAERFGARSPESARILMQLGGAIPDVAFVGRYKVPFAFSRHVRERLGSGIVVEAAEGHELIDIDGNRHLDLTGAYGVNVFGNAFYKQCLSEGFGRVAALGPVLGPYHPVVARNVERLREISGLDQVSFHMSGTEAVMQAVRLARYHTGRSHIVRFCGAYHGWWDDVQPGIGNPAAPGKVYTLAEMSDTSLRVLRQRRNIACVLVNPLQVMHPNASPPGDGALVAGRPPVTVDTQAYRSWLMKLREVCNQSGIVLIFDEIFVGFRIAAGGAQEYFGVAADLVTYGKTLGGGLPVGVLCGRQALMKRYREDRPVDICFARGTFNAHPYVMAAMDAFLDRFLSDALQAHYRDLDECWARRCLRANQAFDDAGLPLAMSHFSSIFSLAYTRASRYNWMLQFYLNARNVALPWTGTGRLILGLDWDEAQFDALVAHLVAAAEAMQADGWWAAPPGLTDRAIRRMTANEMLRARLGWPVKAPTAPGPATAAPSPARSQ